MSTTIDEKVVEMRFDNGQFEQGVSQSMSSIDKLKQALNFDGVSGQAGQAVNVMVSGFDALGSAMKRVIENITDSAWAKFASMISSLTVAPIASGWQKYGNLMKSVQTIMSATRQDWDDQTAQMDFMTSQMEKLNWYTDETSWNMVDMTSNIGKFVSAGVDIETATVAMEGIGSWAGQSGANVEQMSRAMYNLSQAMAMGTLRVQDWMSIENANMATKEFKDTAIQTALAMGELTEKSDGTIVAYDKFGHEVEVTTENFRSTLSANWFTGEVLTTTLKKYGDFADGLHKTVQETGLTATELLGHIDDYREAMKNGEDMTTWVQNVAKEENVSNVQALAEGLEYLSSDYNELGRSAFKASQETKTFSELQMALADATSSAWMGIFQAIVGNYLESKELWSAWAEELYEVFVDPLNEIKRMFMDFGDFGGREGFLDAMWNVWYNIKDIIMSVKEGLETMFPASTALSLLKVIYNLRDFTESIRFIDFPWYSDLDNIRDAVAGVAGVFKNFWTNIKIIANSIGDAWSRIFPEDSKALTFTEILKNVGEWLKRMSDSLVITDEQAAKLERTFAGLFAIIDILKEIIIAVIEPFGELEGVETGLVDGALDVSASIGDMLVSFRDWLKENDVFRKSIGNVVRFILSIPDKLDKLSQDLFGIGLDEVWENIKNAASTAWQYVSEFFTNLPIYAEEASQALFGMSLAEVWDKIKEAVSGAWEAVKQFFAGLRGGEASEVGDTVQQTGESTSEGIGFITNALNTFKEIWEAVSPYIQQMFSMFKENVDFELPSLDQLNDGAKAGGFLVVCIVIAKAINMLIDAFSDLMKERTHIINSIASTFDSISDAFDALKGRIKADTMRVVAETIKTFAAAVLELAVAIFIISLLPLEKAAGSAAIIGGLMALLALIIEEFDSLDADPKKFGSIEVTLLLMMMLIGEIVTALILISREDMKAIAAAAVTIAALIGEVAIIIGALGSLSGANSKQMLAAAGAAAILGIVMLEIAGALKIVGDLPLTGLVGGALALSAILIILTIALAELSKQQGDIFAAAGSAVVMSKVLMKIASAIAIVAGLLPIDSILAGTLALSAVLIIMSIALVELSRQQGDLKKAATAADVMGIALIEIAIALAIIGNLPVAGLISGAVALSVILMVLVLALTTLAQAQGNLFKGAAALMVAAVGLILIAGALAVINQVVEGGHIVETLGLLAGALAILLLAALGAQYVAPGLMALGIAVALMGAGAMMAGAGLLMFATAVEKIAAVGPDAVLGLLTGLVMFFTMIPFFVTQVALAIVSMIQVFIDSKDVLLEGLITFFDIIITAIATVVPKILTLVGEIIVGIIDLVIKLMPKILELIGVLFMGLVQIITEQVPVLIDLFIMITQELLRSIMVLVPEITATVIAILIDTLEQLAANIAPVISLLVQIAIESILGLIDGLTAEIPNIIDSFMNFVLGLINGIADGLDKYAEPLHDAIIRLCNSVINAIKEFFGIHSPSTEMASLGNNVVQGFIDGIGELISKANDKILELADKVITAICDFFGMDKPDGNPASQFLAIGKNIIQGLIDGINKMIDDATSAVTSVADSVVGTFKNVLGIQSPSKVFRSFGRYIDEGLSEGIDDYSSIVRDSSESLGDTAINSMSSALSSITDLVDGEIDSDVTIRPVLDLSNVADGARAINGMLSPSRTMNLAMTSSGDINSKISAQHENANALASLRTAISGIGSRNDGENVINNYFTITGDDPKAIAEEVSRILQTKVERTGAVWA